MRSIGKRLRHAVRRLSALTLAALFSAGVSAASCMACGGRQKAAAFAQDYASCVIVSSQRFQHEQGEPNAIVPAADGLSAPRFYAETAVSCRSAAALSCDSPVLYLRSPPSSLKS